MPDDSNYVTPRECDLHRQVLEAKIEAQAQRVDGLLERIEKVMLVQEEARSMMKWLLITCLGIAIGVALTLFGVLLGRGIDFGWLIP